MVKDATTNKFSELRQRAQAFLKPQPEQAEILEDDVHKLVHELDTYRVELELQNEDLRSAQEELERSRCRYVALYDFAPVAYLTISEKGLIVEANLTAGDMLGVTRSQLINRPFSDFLFPDDQDEYYLHRQQLLKTKLQQSYELRLLKKDNSTFHALLEMSIHPESCHLPLQFWVMVNDISLRKEAELAKIRRIKNRYRAIVMDQNDLVCRFDPKGRITFVNDAYCRCFGVRYMDILGTNFLPDIHKDDLPLAKDQLNNLTASAPEKKIAYRVYLPNGQLSWQQWSNRALHDEAGNVIEYQAVGRDITNLKEAEEKLQNESTLRQLFLDALPCIAMLMQFETREIVASNKAAAAVGAVPGQQCFATWLHKEKPCSWCLAPQLWAKSEAQNNQFWAHGIYWDAYWVPVDDSHYLYYVFDITEKEQQREALKKANDELEQRVIERTVELERSHAQLLHSEKLSAIGNLSASIAHEFNNPLQSVMTIIKGIEKYTSLPQKEQELIALALQECKRMKNLIASLRDFFLPTSSQLSPLDVHAMLDALLLIGKKDFHTRKIKIIKMYATDLPLLNVVADQIKQVFLNLFNNAAYACESGGVITITTEVINGSMVAIRIEDNGIGIPPENMTRLFEPFFTTKPDVKGTGLGLPVSYGIVKKHGGRIEVESEYGKGTVFSVFLPIESAKNEQKIDTAG